MTRIAVLVLAVLAIVIAIAIGVAACSSEEPDGIIRNVGITIGWEAS
jgi:hypothetical protein